MGIPQSCIHIDDQTQYSHLQDHALHLVRPDLHSLLLDVEIECNNHRRSLSTINHAFDPNIERQTAAIQQEA